MISASYMQVFYFVLALTLVMALIAFITSRGRGQRMGNTLLESSIWGFSLVACAGADYLLNILRSSSVLGGA